MTPNPSRDMIAATAADIAAELALPADWPRAGRVCPDRRYTGLLKRAGWPWVGVVIDQPQTEHTGLRYGQRTGPAPREVHCFPAEWLAELCRRLGVSVRDVVRLKIKDD